MDPRQPVEVVRMGLARSPPRTTTGGRNVNLSLFEILMLAGVWPVTALILARVQRGRA